MKSKLESWERQHIKKLTWKLVGTGVAAMLAAAIVVYLFILIGWGNNNTTGLIMFLPWMLVLVYSIPMVYHQGVCDERARNKANKNSNI